MCCRFECYSSSFLLLKVPDTRRHSQVAGNLQLPDKVQVTDCGRLTIGSCILGDPMREPRLLEYILTQRVNMEQGVVGRGSSRE